MDRLISNRACASRYPATSLTRAARRVHPHRLCRLASTAFRPTDRPQQGRTRISSSTCRHYAQVSGVSVDDDSQRVPSFTIIRQGQVSNKIPINPVFREELRAWHIRHGVEKQQDLSAWFDSPNLDGLADTAAPRGQAERANDRDQQDPTSLDGLDFAADLKDLESLDPHHRVLRRGDLVEIQYADTSRDPMVAVFVRRMSSSIFAQFYTHTGKWLHTTEATVRFCVPNYIQPELVGRLIPHLPNTMDEELYDQGSLYDLSVPRDVSAPIVSRLSNFLKQSHDLYRRYATRLDQAHDLIANPEDLKFSTLSNIARKLMNRSSEEQLDPVDLFTVRLALNRAGMAFRYDNRHHRMTGFVHVRSKALVSMVSQVREWMRQYRDELAQNKGDSDTLKMSFQSPGGRIIQEFARKARVAIQESRHDRDATQMGCLGPSKNRIDTSKGQGSFRYRYGARWSADEQLIIKFIDAWASQRSFAGLSDLESQPPLVLKATGMYDHFVLVPGIGFVFLQEIGFVVPWENRVRFDENLLIPSARHSQMLAKMASSINQVPKSPATMMTPDTLEHVRQEGGGAFTYCLDSAQAHEIDDGISLQPQTDGSTWVHVDVANPTAFLDKNSSISRMAQHMTETIYSPDQSYMMLPPWITQGYFSLDEGRPCLRFSARLDNAGNILEYDVTASRSRNVKFIDPHEVNKALGLVGEDSGLSKTLTVGGTPPAPRNNPRMLAAEDITPQMRTELKLLIDLAAKRTAVRNVSDGLAVSQTDRDIHVWGKDGKPGLGADEPSYDRVRYAEGDPVIQLKTKEFSGYVKITGDNKATNEMVQEYMLLACYVGAKWMHDRGIPNIYRGTLPVLSSGAETPTQYFARVIQPFAARNEGRVPAYMVIEYLVRSNPGTLALDPLLHQQLGMTHYSRVTSPLRRYADMLSHWNIGAALVEEHRKGRMLQPAEAEAVVPFTRPALEKMMPMLRAREDRIKRAKKWGINVWTCHLLFRAYYYNELALPKTLTAVITQNKSVLGFPSTFREFEVPCTMEDVEDGKLGDLYEVVISFIDLYNCQIRVKPVRLIHREEAFVEPSEE